MYQTLGLAYRAKKVVIGTDKVIDGVRKNKVYLVIYSNQVSNNTKKLINDKTSYYDVKTLEVPHERLNQALGKTKIKVIGIKDEGFKNLIIKKKGE